MRHLRKTDDTTKTAPAASLVHGLGVLTIVTAILVAGSAAAAPAKAKKLKVDLVSAYKKCTAPNVTHKAPLAFPACTPQLSTDDNATNSIVFGPKGVLSVQLQLAKGDLKISTKGSDILDNGGAYSGTLYMYVLLRVTDNGCGLSTTDPCTTVDFQLPFPVSCVAGKCVDKTTANTLVPGIFAAGDLSNIEVLEVNAADPDPDLAFTMGLLVP